MYGATDSTDTTGWSECGNCNCQTGECRNRRSTYSSASVTYWSITVPAETEYERELRELTEGLTKAFAWRRRRTREGWLQAPQTVRSAPTRLRARKDFQRRPGRPTRHRGHGGPRPIRSRPHIRERHGL